MPHLPTEHTTTTATRALPYPVRRERTKENINTAMDGSNEEAPPAFGVAKQSVVTEKHNTTTASEACIAASHLPILSWFSQGAAFYIGIFAILANLIGLILLFYYFRASCPRQYAILPNEWDATDTPSSITDLEATDGVTIVSTYLIHYKADQNFTQLGSTYWMPFAVTCGICEEECQLASCVGTTPISVEYYQCNAWGEAFSLATGLLVYINMILTLILVTVLYFIPCSHREDAKPSLWDYVKIIAQAE